MSDSRLTTRRTMYRAKSYLPEIEAVTVVSETAKFAVILEREWRFNEPDKMVERRRLKDGLYNTWAECRDAMVAEATTKMDSYKRRVHEISSWIGNLKSLKEPT